MYFLFKISVNFYVLEVVLCPQVYTPVTLLVLFFSRYTINFPSFRLYLSF